MLKKKNRMKGKGENYEEIKRREHFLLFKEAIICAYNEKHHTVKKFKQSIKIKHLDGKTEKFICKLEDINMKYRKKPVEVEAIQYTGSLENVSDLKDHFRGIKMYFENKADILTTYILTLTGSMEVMKGDWIIKGSDAKGGFQFWSVSPEYFAENYEKVEENDTKPM